MKNLSSHFRSRTAPSGFILVSIHAARRLKFREIVRSRVHEGGESAMLVFSSCEPSYGSASIIYTTKAANMKANANTSLAASVFST
jgi:hypothetical protein